MNANSIMKNVPYLILTNCSLFTNTLVKDTTKIALLTGLDIANLIQKNKSFDMNKI